MREKRKTSANITKVEKPLSRNVRFLDLSNNNHSSYHKGTTNNGGNITNRKNGGDSTTFNIGGSNNVSKS